MHVGVNWQLECLGKRRGGQEEPLRGKTEGEETVRGLRKSNNSSVVSENKIGECFKRKG